MYSILLKHEQLIHVFLFFNGGQMKLRLEPNFVINFDRYINIKLEFEPQELDILAKTYN